MFSFFKKPDPTPSAKELSRLTQMACDEVREKWLSIDKAVPFKVGIPLAEKIDAFAQPLSEFFRQNYPKLLAGGSEIFWLTTFSAVLESGTHPEDEVNAAIAQLEAKYGGKGVG